MGKREHKSDLERQASSLEDEKYKNYIPESELSFLPIEMILEIISHLNDIKDFKNCMLLCKQIRVLMCKTPDIMRKYQVSIDLDVDGFMDLPIIKKRGKLIQNLKVKFHKLSRLQSILSKVPNLEVLTYEHKSSNMQKTIDLPELRYLKTINSNDSCHKCFLSDSVNITNLLTLKFCIHNPEEAELITNFLSRQTKLKELIVLDDFILAHSFLTRDISSNIAFKLTKFEYTLNDFSENFQKFFKNQAGSLKELKIRFTPTYNVINTFFTKCKTLEKLTINHECDFTTDDPDYWILESLKHFEAHSVVNFVVVNKRFPNLISLECYDMAPCEGTFDKLENLNIHCHFDCRILNKFKLPNLRNLTANSVEGCVWKHFKRNIPKIENLTFTGVPWDVFTILRSLDYFKDLKSFKQMADRCCRNRENVAIFINLMDKTIDYDKCKFDYKVVRHLNERYVDYKRNNSCYY